MTTKPVSPPVTWFGSKSRLVKKIVSYFPKHTTFVDVFGGSGAILLGNMPSKVEVYNDINKKLVTLFRVLSDKSKTQELIHRLEFTPYARSEFEFCRDNINLITDEIELARMMLVVQRQSFSGLGKRFGFCITDSAAGCSSTVRKFHAGIDRLKNIHHRIRRVQIENLPWQNLISLYDKNTTLFYLDPPYISDTRIGGKYEYEMTNNEHIELVNILLKVNAKVILSGYAHEIYRPLEKAGWKKVSIDTVAYSSTARSERIEYLWISPNCQPSHIPSDNLDLLNNKYSKRQIHAYNIHKQRTLESEELIVNAIKSLKKIGQKVTKSEVARICGISRIHISRRYQYLFMN